MIPISGVKNWVVIGVKQMTRNSLLGSLWSSVVMGTQLLTSWIMYRQRQSTSTQVALCVSSPSSFTALSHVSIEFCPWAVPYGLQWPPKLLQYLTSTWCTSHATNTHRNHTLLPPFWVREAVLRAGLLEWCMAILCMYIVFNSIKIPPLKSLKRCSQFPWRLMLYIPEPERR